MTSPEGDEDPSKGTLLPPQSNEIDKGDLDFARAVAAGGSVLECIRKNATDWRTGLAALLTIVTTALVFKAPEKLSSYASPFPELLGLMAFAAALFGALGMWFLLQAANGSIKQVAKEEVSDKGGLEGWALAQTEAAADQLNGGRVLTALSAALVGGLIAISWFAPSPPNDPPAFVRVTEVGEGPNCGTLDGADAKGVKFKVKGATEAHLVPFAKLVSVVLVAKCE